MAPPNSLSYLKNVPQLSKGNYLPLACSTLSFPGTLLQNLRIVKSNHYNDVIMGAIASQITSLTIVYSIVYSDADQRKHQSSASLAFVRGFIGERWIPCTNGQLRGKCFYLMTSSRDDKNEPVTTCFYNPSMNNLEDDLILGNYSTFPSMALPYSHFIIWYCGYRYIAYDIEVVAYN